MNYSVITFPMFGEGFVINPPQAISVFGFNIYLYGLIIAAGFLLALLYLLKRCDVFGLTKDNVLDMVILAVPGGIIGSRLFFVLFNASDFFGPGRNWTDIFNLRLGGLAIYGGVIGAALVYIIYSRVKKVPFLKLADAGSLGVLIGQITGRWGNFVNREAYGVETTVPWRMGLTPTDTIGHFTIYVHPTFLYESLWNVIGLVLLHIFTKKRKAKYHGQVFLLYVAWYGLGRFMIEGLRTDSIFLGGTGIRVSQLLAALSLVIACVILVLCRMRGVRTIEENP